MSRINPNSVKGLQNLILHILKSHVGNKEVSIEICDRFDSLGLDSLNAMLFIAELEEKLSAKNWVEINLEDLLSHPTTEKLAEFLLEKMQHNEIHQ